MPDGKQDKTDDDEEDEAAACCLATFADSLDHVKSPFFKEERGDLLAARAMLAPAPPESEPATELGARRARLGRRGELQLSKWPRPPCRPEPMRLLHAEDAAVTGEQRQRLVLDSYVSNVSHRDRQGFTAETSALEPVEQVPYLLRPHRASARRHISLASYNCAPASNLMASEIQTCINGCSVICTKDGTTT